MYTTIGSDVSSSDFITYEVTIDPKKPICVKFAYATNQDIAAIIEHYKGRLVHFVMEYTSIYYKRIAFALCKAGFRVSVISSKKSYYFAQSQNNGTKTDKTDAKNLQKIGATEVLPLFVAPKEEDDQKKQKRSYLEKLRQRLQAVKNQQHAWEHEPYGDPMIREMQEDERKNLEEKIKKLEDSLNMTLTEEDKKDINNLKTICGVGEETAKAFVSCVKSIPDFEEHSNSKKLAKLVGLAPQVSQSGKQNKSGATIKAGNNRLKTCLYQGAQAAVFRSKADSPFKSFYKELIQKNKSVKKALVAVMHKMLRVCFAVFKSGEPYASDYMATLL